MLIVLNWKTSLCQKIEGFVVGGDATNIEEFSYSAYTTITCKFAQNQSWACGSSILNQRVLVTAAHCLADCEYFDPDILATVGNSNKDHGITYVAEIFYIHENYDRYYLSNDICLLGLNKSLQFSSKVGRVALIRNYDYSSESAYVAGWGFVQVSKFYFY